MPDLDWFEEEAGTELGDRFVFKHCIDKDGVDCGWIARNGEWYPVEFGFHEAFAVLYLGKSEYDVEQSYTKVNSFGWDGGPERPTRFQRRTLEALGFLNGVESPRYREGDAEDVPMARDLREALDEWTEKNDDNTD